MTFSEKLKYLMTEKGVTQKEVSQQLNIAPSTLNGYANGYREPDFSTLSSLAKYFDVSADFLLGITTIPSYEPFTDSQQLDELIYYYSKLNSDTQKLLIEEAKLLSKYNCIYIKNN